MSTSAPPSPQSAAAASPTPSPPAAPTSDNPNLLAAEAALKTGHFAAARVLLDQPAQPGDSEHRRALLWRFSPDPLVAILIAGCLIFFGYVALTTQH